MSYTNADKKTGRHGDDEWMDKTSDGENKWWQPWNAQPSSKSRESAGHQDKWFTTPYHHIPDTPAEYAGPRTPIGLEPRAWEPFEQAMINNENMEKEGMDLPLADQGSSSAAASGEPEAEGIAGQVYLATAKPLPRENPNTWRTDLDWAASGEPEAEGRAGQVYLATATAKPLPS